MPCRASPRCASRTFWSIAICCGRVRGRACRRGTCGSSFRARGEEMSETTMDVRAALDHLRSYYTRNVKPFRELLDVLEVAASVNDALPTAQAELAKLEGEIPVARAQLATIAQEVLTAKDHAATAIRRGRAAG